MELSAIPVLPANAPATVSAPVLPLPGVPLVIAGPIRPFPEMLVALTEGNKPASPSTTGEAATPAAALPVMEFPAPQAETGDEPADLEPGNDLPEPVAEGGKTLPVANVTTPVTLVTIMLQTITAEPAPAENTAASPTRPYVEPRFPGKQDALLQAPGTDGSSPVMPDAEGPSRLVPVAAAPASVEADPRPEIQIAREVTPALVAPALTAREAPLAPSASLQSPVAAPSVAGEHIEALVEVLSQAREAGRGARGEVTLRHAEFGAVAIRIEQAEGETRAVLNGRDPGFAPAVMAALADRAATGSADYQQPSQQRGGDQSGQASAQGQPQSQSHGDSRQPDRRQMQHDLFVPAGTNRSDRDGNTSGEYDRPQGRFA